MNRTILVILTLELTCFGTFHQKSGGHVVLPNSKLIGCKGSGCSQLWQATRDAAAIYPHNLSIDIEDGAILGIAVHYDKSAS